MKKLLKALWSATQTILAVIVVIALALIGVAIEGNKKKKGKKKERPSTIDARKYRQYGEPDL